MDKTNYELAIFDMDGTILNTLEDLKNSLNYSLAICDFPPRTISEVRRFVGNGIRKLVERGVPANASKEQIDKVFDVFNEHYSVHCADNTRPYDGVVEAIKALRSAGVRTAVVSNKADYAVQSLCKQYFGGLFDFAVGAREGIRKKPFPDSVNAVLQNLEVNPKNSVYIGDTEVDFQTAVNSKMRCILVDWGFRDRNELETLAAENEAENVKIISDAKTLINEIANR